MIGWVDNIEKLTVDNDNFRTVVYTGKHSQLTVMSVPPGGEIGWEAHGHLDQFLRIEMGKGRLDLGTSENKVEESHAVEDDWAFIIPATLESWTSRDPSVESACASAAGRSR